MEKAKPFDIPKPLVVQAWKQVKANKGAGGTDNVTMEAFEKDLGNNLYKVWNRMSSGSYFPPAVRTVLIPKKNGGERKLGIPCISDRVAQMVVKLLFEPSVEKIFHADSYGYRPNRSATDAIAVTRKRCWKYGWVLEFDIKGLFDNIPSDLIMRAVKKHAETKWIILYIERWLNASIVDENGNMTQRDRGVPQGGVISPVLSNLFMHYAFDYWMKRNYSQLPFCRYADDGLIHCRTYQEACNMKHALSKRLSECGVEIHPEKTKIVCCHPKNKHTDWENKFEFLGYEFRPRLVKGPYGFFTSITPAISPKSAKSIREKVREWQLWRQHNTTLQEISEYINPIIQGWINYYGHFQQNQLKKVLRYIDLQLIKWVKWKYRKRSRYFLRAKEWLDKFRKYNGELFPHWRIGVCL